MTAQVMFIGVLAAILVVDPLGAQSAGGQPTRFPPGQMPPTTSARPPVGSATRRPNPRPTVAAGGSGGPYIGDSAIVENDEVRLLIAPLDSAFRFNLHGRAGFFGWRVDVNEGDGLAIALAADTAMRSTNYVRLVNGSRLRRCQDPLEPSARRCNGAIDGTVRARSDFVYFVLKDTSVVSFFRRIRPTHMYGTTYEPNGRFRIDPIPISYRDRPLSGIVVKR